jgi:hypothetical protein
MKKLTRKHLVITFALATAGTACAWMLVTAPANARVNKVESELSLAKSEFLKTERTARSRRSLEINLVEVQRLLNQKSKQLLSGDKYLWVIRSLSKYHTPQLEFTAFDQPVDSDWGFPGAEDLDAVSFLVRGVGVYEELGRFTAALENDYPGLRFRSITLSHTDPISEGKIAFTLDIVGLVSPTEKTLKIDRTSVLTKR